MSFNPYMLKVIIDRLTNARAAAAVTAAEITAPALLYVIAWAVAAINFRFTDWVKIRFFPAIRQDIIHSMFNYLNNHSYSYFQNNFAGSLSNKISDMNSGIIALLGKFDEALAYIFAVAVAAITMYFVHPLFTIILLGWIVVLMIVSISFTRKAKRLSNIFSESKSAMMGKVVDSISNIVNIKSFAQHSYENNLISHAIGDTISKDRNMQKCILNMRICQDITFVSLMGGMFWGLIYMYKINLVTAGDFVLILTIALSISQGMWWLSNQLVEFAEEIGKCTQALSIISKNHEITDAIDAIDLKVTQGKIAFNNVTFKYEHGNHIFKNKNVIIEPGQKVGLVGFSGSGKSTFANLILRFFDVSSGSITIDDVDIKTVSQNSLRKNISMIPQDSSLFHRSLLENIRYGNVDASYDQVIAASKQAFCHEFIIELPEQYEALVGERGIKLSGGQRQRIAIARAILKNAPILILDEATSALDSVTENKIQQCLHMLMQTKTTIVIAHRLSTLDIMDRILVFDKGNIIEDGTHSELLTLNGHYAKMWRMQAGGFLPDVDETVKN
jgi:ATP-binding cassette subfamily B protein